MYGGRAVWEAYQQPIGAVAVYYCCDVVKGGSLAILHESTPVTLGSLLFFLIRFLGLFFHCILCLFCNYGKYHYGISAIFYSNELRVEEIIVA